MKEDVTFSHSGGSLTARICCELDHHTVRRIRERIDARLFKDKPERLMLDFSGVGFMDSSGIAVVINAFRLMAKMEGKLEIAALGQQPMKVFRASGIDKLVNIKEEVR
jgi:stage II sporulation protein AA (anti-sigma F factor antagonist)